jgi:hypothetical protein
MLYYINPRMILGEYISQSFIPYRTDDESTDILYCKKIFRYINLTFYPDNYYIFQKDWVKI